MNRSAGIFVLVTLVTLVTVFLYIRSRYLPEFRWHHSFNRSSDQPYGLKIFYDAVDAVAPAVNVITLPEFSVTANYEKRNLIFVYDHFWLDSVAAAKMLAFVAQGNRVLIAGNYVPAALVRTFIPDEETIAYSEFEEKHIRMVFDSSVVGLSGPLEFHYRQLKDTVEGQWSYYRSDYFHKNMAAAGFRAFGTVSDTAVTCYYRDHGEGRIIFHTNPLLFCNYYMVRSEGYLHAKAMLSLLHAGPVYWVEPGSSTSSSGFSASHRKANNPLKFLFSHPHLRWGWYMFLITILLYLLFHSKRQQRVIPLSPDNSNTSVAFAKALGTVYFQHKGHAHIALEMQQAFLADVRGRYGILTDQPEMELIEQLSQRSEVPKETLHSLLRQFSRVTTDPSAGSDALADLYNAIESYNERRK